ncbi:hypothetical protein BH24ACT26_BH24ACT26_09290 [soil metagenome]
MAIKGKKKSQSRGSQARRRPAAAPRPVAVSRRTPWYRTDRGRAIAAAIAALVIAVVWWAVARDRASAEDLERRQGTIESYTDRARALLQAVRPAAQEMSRAPTGANAKGVTELAGSVPSWKETLTDAGTEASELFAAPAVANVNGLLSQSVGLYLAAAKTYGLVERADERLQADLLARAAEQRDAASGVWLTATGVLDAERSRVELGRSGLGLPSTAPPGAQPALPGSPGGGG